MTHAGQKIKMLRDSKSWSREQLAGKVGISVETIARTEQGKRKLTIDEIELFSEIFNVEPSFFFGSHNLGHTKTSDAKGQTQMQAVDPIIISSMTQALDKLTDFLQNRLGTK